MKSITRSIWFGLFIILISSVIILSKILWKNGVPFSGDFSFPLTVERYLDTFQMWDPYPSSQFFTTIFLSYMLPFLGVTLVLQLSIETLVKLMLLVGLFLVGLSMYVAAKEVLDDVKGSKETKIIFASLIASFLYMLNPWSMDRVGHYFLWIGYALAPLVLLLAIKLTQQNKLNYKLIFLTSLIWSISSTQPFSAILSTLLLFSWIFYSALLATLSKQYSKIFSHLKALILTLTLFVLFNAHWILPYVIMSMTQTPKPQYIVSWENVNVLSQNSNFLNVIRLVAYWWPQVQYWPNSLSYAPWILASIMLPLTALSTLLLRRDKYTVYFSLMYIFSIPLSMGLNGPFQEMYKWLTFDAPFSNAIGWVFRDSNKWNSLTALASSILLGISLYEIFSRSFKSININSVSRFQYLKKQKKAILVILILVTSTTLYMAPTAIGYFAQIYAPVEVPQEYYRINDWLKNQPGDFRVLWLAPLSSGTVVNGLWRFSWAPEKPYVPLDSYSSAKPSIAAAATNEAKRYTDFLYKSIADGDVNKYLASLGVKYIIYHNDVLGAETQGKLDIERLMAQKELKLVRSEGFIYIFEIQSYTPRIFAPSKTLLVVGGLDSIQKLDLSNSSLIFLEQMFYDPSIINITKDVVIIDKDLEDLALSFLDKQFVIGPFEYTINADPFKGWAKTNVYEDWWTWPSPKNLTGFWDWDYGIGVVKTTIPNAKLDLPYAADHGDTYSVWIRYLESPLGGEISVSVDENSLGIIDTLGSEGFKWFKAGSISLDAGEHNLLLQNINGFNSINAIALVPISLETQLFDLAQNLNVTYITENHPEQSVLFPNDVNTVLNSETFASIKNYTQISSTEWLVYINATKPFVLELRETYDPFWTVDIDGVTIQSYPINSVNNGFLINKTGSLTLLIKYKPQSYFYAGLWVSSISFITVSVILVVQNLRTYLSVCAKKAFSFKSIAMFRKHRC